MKIGRGKVKPDELDLRIKNEYESIESIYDEYRPLYRPIPTES